MPIVKLKKGVKLIRYDPTKKMKDKKYVAAALWDCLLHGDADAFKDILSTHLMLVNKEKICKETGIARRTLFRMLSPEGNPTLENICKLLQAMHV